MSRLAVLSVLLASLVASTTGAAARSTSARAVPGQALVESPHDWLAIIVNKDNAISDLSVTDLRRILLGEMTRWPDGRRITVAMRQSGQPERDALLRLICRMSEIDFNRFTLQAAYRGEAPGTLKQLDTPTSVRRFVFNVPGAIGYVRHDEVDDSVKIIRVVGSVPHAPAFGLSLRVQ